MELKRYDIIPVAKPRMTRRDSAKSKQNRIQGMRKCVAKYFAFKNEVRAAKVKVPTSGAHIVFAIPMPKGWPSKKRRDMDGKPHQAKKDVDNLLKGLLDAVYKDDACVWDVRISKVWANSGKIIILENAENDEPMQGLWLHGKTRC